MNKLLTRLALVLALTATMQVAGAAQDNAKRRRTVGDDQSAKQKEADAETASAPVATQTPQAGETSAPPSELPPEAVANRRSDASEEAAAILPYYNNYLSSYRLGPEDVISISVFGQERYSKVGIVIPPDGRIAYPLIPEGVFVAGRTAQQLQDELVKRLDEYIIDPKITVTLEKAMSARYSVLGDVAQPGIRTMTRRLSVYEAIAEAGGVLNTGDKSKVFVLRRQADGTLRPFLVNLKEIERGRAKEMAFLAPGDQVIVPGNRLKKIQSVMNLLSVVSFARVFTGF
jgi:polysaccharide biosynthesis/export protein